jgi:hypothetical protein
MRMVPERLKVTNDPEFTKYACKDYIIDNDKICDDDAKGYFSDGSLSSDKKEEVLDEYFSDHLQDDITEDNHGEGEGYNPFNKFDAKSNNDFVDPVCNVLVASNDEGPEQSIMKMLSKKKLARITTSDVPMNLRKSPPERFIDQSTTQNISLMLPSTNSSTTLVACSAKKKIIINRQSHLKKTLRRRKFCPRSPRPQKHWRLCVQKQLLIFNCHHHLKIPRLIPNSMSSMRQI